jgi:hypothetical protein
MMGQYSHHHQQLPAPQRAKETKRHHLKKAIEGNEGEKGEGGKRPKRKR